MRIKLYESFTKNSFEHKGGDKLTTRERNYLESILTNKEQINS